MAIGNLTTLDAVKAFLSLTSTEDDALLESLITRLSMWAQRVRMQRVIAVSSYSKQLMGTGQRVYVFNEWPVLSITSIVIGTRTLLPTVDYWHDDTTVYLEGGIAFPVGVRCVLTWSAGFATVPPELEQATIQLVAYEYRGKSRIGVSTQTLAGSETVSYITAPANKSALDALDAYRKVMPS